MVVGAMRYRLMPARTENEMGEGDAWRARMSSTGVSDDILRIEKQMNMNIRLLAYV